MLKSEQLEAMIKQLLDSLPPTMQTLNTDLRKNFHSIIQRFFADLDLVPREEFDVQTTVLTRLREKLETLEKQLNELEQRRQESSQG